MLVEFIRTGTRGQVFVNAGLVTLIEADEDGGVEIRMEGGDRVQVNGMLDAVTKKVRDALTRD